MRKSRYDYRAGVGLPPIQEKPDLTKLTHAENPYKNGGDSAFDSGVKYNPLGDSLAETMEIEREQDDTMIITLTEDEYNQYSGLDTSRTRLGDAHKEEKPNVTPDSSGGGADSGNVGGGGGSLVPNKPNLLLLGGLGLFAFLLIKK